MNPARKAILKAAGGALSRKKPDGAAVAEDAKALLAGLAAIRPNLPSASVTGSFLQKVSASKVAATAELITSIAGLPQAVARHLAKKGLPVRIALQPSQALASLDWSGAGLATGGEADGGVAVGIARWGIAETGSLVFHSAADTPLLLNFLPAAHIVAVRASTIVTYLEDYAQAARESGDPVPRNACLITGASGTTDIEGNLVLGAHGPRELRIIVINDDPEPP